MRVVALVAVALLLAGCSTPAHVVRIRDFSFSPEELTVSAGDTVTFTDDGAQAHTVTIHDPSGRTVLDEELSTGQSASHKFVAKGNHHVFCRFHAQMSLSVRVT